MFKNLKDKNRIIVYSDDNHGQEVYVNGEYTAYMDDGIEAAYHLLLAGQSLPKQEIVTASLYPFDSDIPKDEVDIVIDFFSKCEHLTEEQELAILNQDYKKLISTLKCDII